MADGEWKITQYAPAAKTGVKITTIPVVKVGGTIHDTEPVWWTEPALQFRWTDGREQHYSWASIVKAEYTPPTP